MIFFYDTNMVYYGLGFDYVYFNVVSVSTSTGGGGTVGAYRTLMGVGA